MKQERKELMFVKYDAESMLAQIAEIKKVVGELNDMIRKLHESSAEIKLEKAPAETDA